MLTQEQMLKLMEPFDVVSWKPQTRPANKVGPALAVTYIDARDVMDRLDDVVGMGEWADSYDVLRAADKAWAVRCRLTLCGITKEDVGEGESPKEAFSDALKRAAVKFGVGRYLYSLPKMFADYDTEKNRFTPEGMKKLEETYARAIAALRGAGNQPAEATVPVPHPRPNPVPPSPPAPKPPQPPVQAPSKNSSHAQIMELFKALGAAGDDDGSRTLRLSILHAATGREIVSSRDLTQEVTDRVVAYLKALKDSGVQPDQLGDFVTYLLAYGRVNERTPLHQLASGLRADYQGYLALSQ